MKRNFNKMLSLVLVLMMVVSTMVILPLTAHAEDAPATGFAIAGLGSGTEADPYLVDSSADVFALRENFANLVAPVYVKMTSNIELEASTGNYIAYVAGTGEWSKKTFVWDGNGYALSGMNVPLFCMADTGMRIYNTRIENSTITASHQRGVGAFIAWIYTATDVSFVNCAVDSTVSITSTHATAGAGGFVGEAYLSASFENCISEAVVTAAGATGGFVGRANKEGTKFGYANFVDCIADATVTSSGSSAAAFFGGIWCDGSAAIATSAAVTFENCVASGTVSGATSTAAFVGLAVNNTAVNKPMTLTNCYTDIEGVALVDAAFTTVTKTNCYTATEAADTANADAIATINAAAHTHVYAEAACATICIVCGETRTSATSHEYTNICDASCNNCGETRVVAGHAYTNACDAECNNCGETRTIAGHVYNHDCDTDCNTCGESRTVAGHAYDNGCDAYCNKCFAERTIEHTYDNACDAKCNVCETERTPADHVYTDDADTTCDVCAATRTVETKPVETTTTTTPATTTTAAPAEEGGCGSAMNSTYAIIALVAVLGFALVAKKREEN